VAAGVQMVEGKRSNFGSLSSTNYTYTGKHKNRKLAYLWGILDV